MEGVSSGSDGTDGYADDVDGEGEGEGEGGEEDEAEHIEMEHGANMTTKNEKHPKEDDFAKRLKLMRETLLATSTRKSIERGLSARWTSTSNWAEFDEELVIYVIGYLERVKDVFAMLATCRHWHKCAEGDQLWVALCHLRFGGPKIDDDMTWRAFFFESLMAWRSYNTSRDRYVWACQNGHVNLLRPLYDFSAKTDRSNTNTNTSNSNSGRSPLKKSGGNPAASPLAQHNIHIQHQQQLQGGHNNNSIKEREREKWKKELPLYISLAVVKGHLEVVRWGIQRLVSLCKARAEATSSGSDSNKNSKKKKNADANSYKAYLNKAAVSNSTPLYLACQTGHLKIAELLLQRGADPNIQQRRNKVTALYISCQKGNERAVDLLLSHGADPNKPNVNGATPLFIAASHGFANIVKLLLTHGADPFLISRKSGSPLYAACLGGYLDVLKMLVHHSLSGERAGINEAYGQYSDTPILIAAEFGHLEVAEYLLSIGVDINRENNFKSTPIYGAARAGHTDVVKSLLQAGADWRKTKEGRSPLYAAAEMGRLDTFKLLYTVDNNIEACTSEGATMLYQSARNGHHAMVEELLSKGALVDSQKNNCVTPLWIASYNGHASIAELLLQAGACIDQQRRDGATPLYMACYRGHANVVEVLLRYKANVEHEYGVHKKFPLLVAANKGRIEIAKMLLDAGAVLDRCAKEETSQHSNNASINNSNNTDSSSDNDATTTTTTTATITITTTSPVRGGLSSSATAGSPASKARSGSKKRTGPLSAAVGKKHVDMVKLLLDRGADPELGYAIPQTPPLLYACQMGYVSIAELLLSHGASPHRISWGCTPLVEACHNKHFEIVKLLLNTHGVEVDSKFIKKIRVYTTPAIVALLKEHKHTQKHLRTSGGHVIAMQHGNQLLGSSAPSNNNNISTNQQGRRRRTSLLQSLTRSK